MRMALSCEGSSPARAMRLRSSRQERPASTRIRVREEEMTVLLPFDPEASTVIRIIRLRYACWLWVFGGSNWYGSGRRRLHGEDGGEKHGVSVTSHLNVGAVAAKLYFVEKDVGSVFFVEYEENLREEAVALNGFEDDHFVNL